MRGNFIFAQLFVVVLFSVVSVSLVAENERHWPKAWYLYQADKIKKTFVVRSKDAHKIALLPYGINELAAKLELIELAQKSICFETFIFNSDKSGQLILQALVKKVQQGVKVRLLIDRSPLVCFALEPLREAVNNGVEVRLYNPKSIFLQPNFSKWRDHRKYFSVDGKFAIVSGRNQSDEYFNLSSNYNFKDFGLCINGPIVKALDKVFDAFFDHPFARKLGSSYKKNKKANIFKKNNELLQLKMLLDNFSLQSCPFIIVKKLTVISDKPGRGTSRRIVHNMIWSKIAAAKKSVAIISPTFVLFDRGARSILHSLIQKQTELIVCTDCNTNTIGSYYSKILKATTRKQAKYWQRKGIKFVAPDHFNFIAKENSNDLNVNHLDTNICAKPLELHTKMTVFDHKDIMVGSYNFDPQSRRYSAEMMVLIEDCPELAGIVEGNLKQDKTFRLANSKNTLFKNLFNWLGKTMLRIAH